MPQIFKLGSYWVYFWTNEGEPLEPIYVHIAEGKPLPNATKIWITKDGKWYLWEQFILADIRQPESANPWA